MELDGYKINDTLGVGATSEVYSATRLDDDNNVALKMFLPLFTNDPQAISRIQEEVKALAVLNDPNIVKLYSQIQINGQFGLELELVEGEDLRKRMDKGEPSFVESKIWLLVQVARGLGTAHELGILHRDLKPENILISDQGEVKLTDFGLSKCTERLTMTRVGLLVGSLGYMPPEIVNGEKASMASDVFSFGAIAYELLAGRAPFEAETPQALIKSIMDHNVPALKTLCPELPGRICEVIDRCLAKDPAKRPEGIWSIEAEFTNYLVQSGLFQHSKNLLKKNVDSIQRASALKAKHNYLLRQANAILNEEYIQRQTTIDLINEIQGLFPEEAIAFDLLNHINNRKRASGLTFARQQSSVLLAVLAFVLFGFVVFFLNQDSELEVGANVLSPSATLANPKTDTEKQSANRSEDRVETGQPEVKASVPPKVVKAKAAPQPQPPKVQYGRVKFLVDPEVDVYVDDKLVPISQIHSYRLKAGKHNLKLSKAGFLPIEGQIQVKANKLTTIKANGN